MIQIAILLTTLLAPTGSSTDSLLHANAIVRIRVPTMKATWFGGRVVRSTSAGGCLAVMLEMTNPEERQRFVFLSGVDSLRVDRRTNTGVMALQLGPAAEDDWQAFSPAELAEANAGCRGTRRPAARPRPAKSR